jgi:hypothetical protein
MNLKQIDRLAFTVFETIEQDLAKLTEPQKEQLIDALAYYIRPNKQEQPARLQIISRAKIIRLFNKGVNQNQIALICGCSRTYVHKVIMAEGLIKTDN